MCYLGLLFLFGNGFFFKIKIHGSKEHKTFPACSFLPWLSFLIARPLFLSFYFSSGILSCSAVLVCNSEFYGLGFLTNFSLHLSPFPVLKALAFHSLILVKTETPSANKISPYKTINFFLSTLTPLLFLKDKHLSLRALLWCHLLKITWIFPFYWYSVHFKVQQPSTGLWQISFPYTWFTILC